MYLLSPQFSITHIRFINKWLLKIYTISIQTLQSPFLMEKKLLFLKHGFQGRYLSNVSIKLIVEFQRICLEGF